MNADCPLPIDWLDLLEGRPSIAAYPHLAECRSCAQTVEAIQNVPQGRDLGQPPAANADATHHAALGQTNDAEAAGTPSTGDVYWLDDIDHALPVLVLGVQDFDGIPAADIAPAWLDVEAAAAGDLLLKSEDTTSGRPWRVVLRLQTVVPLTALAGRLARSTPVGLNAVQDALAGSVSTTRTGSPLESPNDPRLAANAWMSVVLERALSSFYIDDDDIEEPEDDVPGEPAPPVLRGAIASPPTERSPETPGSKPPSIGQVVQFLDGVTEVRKVLLTVDERRAKEDYVLAASTQHGPSIYVAHAVDSDLGIDGRLWLDVKSDRMLWEPSGLPSHFTHMLLVLWVNHREEPLTADLDLHHTVAPLVLAEDQGISERDIMSMEMYLK